jgi:hypothetical protein
MAFRLRFLDGGSEILHASGRSAGFQASYGL